MERSTRQLHELRIGVPAMASRVQLYNYGTVRTVSYCNPLRDSLLRRYLIGFTCKHRVHINAIE